VNANHNIATATTRIGGFNRFSSASSTSIVVERHRRGTNAAGLPVSPPSEFQGPNKQKHRIKQGGRKIPQDGLSLSDFVHQNRNSDKRPPTVAKSELLEPRGTFHIKTYGCQMNVSDSDIVRAVLLENGYREATVDDTCSTDNKTSKKKSKILTPESTADIILTNTCAIREKAEEKVWQRLYHLRKNKGSHQIVGVLGCMAERLQTKLLEGNVADLVVGPDAYRELPQLLQQITGTPGKNKNTNKNTNGDECVQDAGTQSVSKEEKESQLQLGSKQTVAKKRQKREKKNPRPKAINVDLSTVETYDDIMPVRGQEASNPFSAFVSIQRGCSNRCSFCIVPFTRGGKERSRPFQSIIDEISYMVETQNLKEVVLLGQNVNSYHDRSPLALQERPEMNVLSLSNDGFRSRIRRPNIGGYRFVDLVEAVADVSPELRIRYTSPHPKDYPLELLQLMVERPNVCSQLHMPAQSGSTDMLKRMKRGYTREAYIELIDTVRSVIPDVAISSDFIAGFCDETEDEHKDTLSLLEYVEYEQAFLFAYSMRDKTHASRAMQDNVAADIKQRRLQELIDVFREKVHSKNERVEVGQLRLVLVEGPTKKQKSDLPDTTATWHGRTDQNKRILFHVEKEPGSGQRNAKIWKEDYVLELLQQQQQQPTSVDFQVPLDHPSASARSTDLNPGDYAVVSVTEAKGHTLRGRVLWKTTISNFAAFESGQLTKLRSQDLSLLQENLFPGWDMNAEGRLSMIANTGEINQI
jgi:MiaB/RimO family radical SAM methylthiotransferase